MSKVEPIYKNHHHENGNGMAFVNNEKNGHIKIDVEEMKK